MKYIKKFNNYNRINENISEEFYKDVEVALHETLDHLEKFYKNLNSVNKNYLYNQNKENIYNFINTNFPRGLQNIPELVRLYRILNVENIEDIKKDNLGKHYVGDINMFNDEEFLNEIGIYFFDNLYIIEITTPLLNISTRATIFSKIEFPEEYEYTIKNSMNIEIVDITKFEMK